MEHLTQLERALLRSVEGLLTSSESNATALKEGLARDLQSSLAQFETELLAKLQAGLIDDQDAMMRRQSLAEQRLSALETRQENTERLLKDTITQLEQSAQVMRSYETSIRRLSAALDTLPAS